MHRSRESFTEVTFTHQESGEGEGREDLHYSVFIIPQRGHSFNYTNKRHFEMTRQASLHFVYVCRLLIGLSKSGQSFLFKSEMKHLFLNHCLVNTVFSSF